MRVRSLLLLPLAILWLAACNDSDSSSPTSSSPRIEAGLVGTWAKPSSTFATDTLIFAETKFRTPSLSGNGSLFSATGGIVKGGPSMAVVGEYLLDKDTLYYDGLIGSMAPDGVNRTEYNRYLRVGN